VRVTIIRGGGTCFSSGSRRAISSRRSGSRA
jgi:hypothetical protein